VRITVITLFPEMIHQALSWGVVGKAIQRGLIELKTVNPRDFANNKHNTVDDRPFGGGAGMVMMYDPLERALQSLKTSAPVTFMSPQGKRLDQNRVNQMATRKELVLLCGRYEGVDQRFLDKYVDEEVSLGDFVISGGELAAAVLTDAVARQIPGVLGDAESAMDDSFMQNRLGYPQYTRSEKLGRKDVPAVLLSGDHAAIRAWRTAEAERITREKRPDLLAEESGTAADGETSGHK
jgi:tRNA (guanine37-N1)-methyltransferase